MGCPFSIKSAHPQSWIFHRVFAVFSDHTTTTPTKISSQKAKRIRKFYRSNSPTTKSTDPTATTTSAKFHPFWLAAHTPEIEVWHAELSECRNTTEEIATRWLWIVPLGVKALVWLWIVFDVGMNKTHSKIFCTKGHTHIHTHTSKPQTQLPDRLLFVWQWICAYARLFVFPPRAGSFENI